MEIPAKLLEHKYHIAVAFIASIILAFSFQVAPQFITILSYFWPLLLSTSLFLVAMIVLAHISPSVSDFYSENDGEGLLDYVAGRPEQLEDF